MVVDEHYGVAVMGSLPTLPKHVTHMNVALHSSKVIYLELDQYNGVYKV